MLFTLAALALGLTGPGAERLFQDWVVTCDNVARCEASLVRPADTDAGNPHDVLLSREAGPAGTMEIAFTARDRIDGIIDLLIDGRLVGTGMFEKGEIRLKGAAAEGLARAMVNGKRLSLRFGRRVFATVPLGGSSAMLRYIDAEQGRAGGVTAIAARGTKPASAVPAAKPVPRVTAIRPPAGVAKPLDAALLSELAAQGDCEAALPAHLKPEFHRLDARTILVLVPCSAGPSSSTHLLFTARGRQIDPARFDLPPANEKGEPLTRADGPAEIAMAEWEGGMLATASKSNYPGGCGVAQTWVWDGERLRMTVMNRLGVCGRWAMWLTAWRAEPVWRQGQ